MEQYIYIFTIILEIIVFLQTANAIININKKITRINHEVILLKSEVEFGIKTFKKLIKKFNKVASFIVKVKKFNIKKIILIGVDVFNLFLLFKTFKAYKGLNKITFFKKVFSYSLIKSFFKVAINNFAR